MSRATLNVEAHLRRLDRTVRLRLPSPWWRWAGTAARLPLLKRKGVRRALREDAFIERALAADDAPGTGALAPPDTSERVVEIPWVVRRVRARGGRVLDIGTAFASIVYQRALRDLPVDELHTVDLAATRLPYGISHTADVRELPLPSGTFDIVICISTLEHIGLDNTTYFDSDAARRDEHGDVTALRELGRVLNDDGLVLVTVPAGCEATFPTQRQYSLERWRSLVDSAGLQIADQDACVHDEDFGWRPAADDEVGERTYGEGAPYAAAVICASLQRASKVGREDVSSGGLEDTARRPDDDGRSVG